MTELEKKIKAKIPGEDTGIEIKRSLCAICSPGLHCGVDCYVKDGKILRIEGTPEHPFNKFIISKTPAARWGTTDDLVGPAVFLASDASDFVNGHVLYVDGGILAYIGKQPQ